MNDVQDKIQQALELKKDEKFEEALEILNQLFSNEPSLTIVKTILIEVLFEYGNYLNDDWVEEFEKAVECFTNIINLDAEHYRAWYNLGISYFRLEETEKALKAYEQALKIKPDYEYIYYNIGLLHETLNKDFETAIIYYEKALSLNENFMYAIQALRDVRKKLELSKVNKENSIIPEIKSKVICKECGNINRATAKFCDNCGKLIK